MSAGAREARLGKVITLEVRGARRAGHGLSASGNYHRAGRGETSKVRTLGFKSDE